jgi:putative membrane protein
VAAVSPTATPVRSVPRQDDNAFAMTVAQNGMAEVALAKLALQKSKNADVKKFAQRVITDHTKVGQELKKIAAAKNITLPAEVKPEQKETHDRFMKLSGAEFDREFMNLMVENHGKSITAFEAESNNGTDAELKAFAGNTLPTLREHLQMARDTTGKLT